LHEGGAPGLRCIDAFRPLFPLPQPVPIADRGSLREYPAENVSQNGHIPAEPVRPVCSLEAPELTNLDRKRRMVQKIESATAAAYADIANTDEVLILINHNPLKNVGWQQSLQSDKPEIVAAIAQINR
jgi:hypothetical protein